MQEVSEDGIGILRIQLRALLFIFSSNAAIHPTLYRRVRTLRIQSRRIAGLTLVGLDTERSMNGLIDFVRSMTVWNWIALIAFIFFPLSAWNAFLSLKSRYRDWNGTKNKQKFDKRLRELKAEFAEIQ